MIRREWDIFVSKYYRMDPETEDLVFDGTELRNGMVVLAAEPDQKVDNIEQMNESRLHNARIKNRFCIVTKLQDLGSSIAFAGVYEDGTIVRRTANKSYSWIVKRDSIPTDDETFARAVKASWLLDDDVDELIRQETNNPRWNREEETKFVPAQRIDMDSVLKSLTKEVPDPEPRYVKYEDDHEEEEKRYPEANVIDPTTDENGG